jgi:hypothetical protein
VTAAETQADLELVAALVAEPPPVYVALARAKAAVPHVEKDRTASGAQGGYKFRGIEGVLDAIHAVNAEHGLVTIPRDLEVEREPWPHYSGSGWVMTRVHVEWTIYGPAGDSIVTDNWGEALDNADKGLGKARSYAQKDLWIRLYELPTNDPALGDTETTSYQRREHDEEPSEPLPALAPVEEIADVLGRLSAVLADEDGIYPVVWRENPARADQPGTFKRESLEAMVLGERGPCREEDLARMVEILDGLDRLLEDDFDSEDPEPDLEDMADHLAGGPVDTSDPTAEPSPEGPCQICGSARSKKVLVGEVWRCEIVSECAKRVEAKADENTAAKRADEGFEQATRESASNG